MIDKSKRIKDINHKKLCICYYVRNSDDVTKLELSLSSQLNNTNINNFSVLIFTSKDLYNIVQSQFKTLIGLANIIKVSPLFLNRFLLLPHNRIQEYKVCVISKAGYTISNPFSYNKLIDYHITNSPMFMANKNIKKFEDRFNKLYKDVSQNTLSLSYREIKTIVFNCYCSRVNKESQYKTFVRDTTLYDTGFLSFPTKLVKSPELYSYIKNIFYNGLKGSDVLLRVYSDAKGYKINTFESTRLGLVINDNTNLN